MVAFDFPRTTRPAQPRQLARTSDGDTPVIDHYAFPQVSRLMPQLHRLGPASILLVRPGGRHPTVVAVKGWDWRAPR
jgi:hypothetical protein